jgi:hypothetical protein
LFIVTVELQRNGQGVVVPARWEWTAEITTDPSPTCTASKYGERH